MRAYSSLLKEGDMKKRWLIYAVIGILFGVADFFYQGLMQNLSPLALQLALILGVWLVPAFLVALPEARATRSSWKAGLATMFSWSMAVLAYYLFMAIKLAYIGEPSRPEMHISNSAAPEFLANWQVVLRYDILGGIKEWAPLALVGGFLVGWAMGGLYLLWTKPRPSRKPGVA